MSLVSARNCMPELFGLIESLAIQIDKGTLKSWDDFERQANEFYTTEQLAKIELYVPGWGQMASSAGGVTLIHVTSALVGLVRLPEYQSASWTAQQIMEWIVLFHDVGKQLKPEGGRDAAHAFRSAALTAQGLQHNGFVQVDNHGLNELCNLIQSAIKFDARNGQETQDNSILDQIIDEIDNLFRYNTPEALVLKSVLLHMSIDVVTDWPQVTPLDETDIKKCLDRDLLPYLRALMLVDNDAWATFDPEEKKKYRQETLSVFERLGKVISDS